MAEAAKSGRIIDLRPHCDRSPLLVPELLPLRRAFRIFQTMGLRHLSVVNSEGSVVGILTRKDFLNVAALNRGEVLSAVRKRRQKAIDAIEQSNRESMHSPPSSRSPSRRAKGRIAPVDGMAMPSVLAPDRGEAMLSPARDGGPGRPPAPAFWCAPPRAILPTTRPLRLKGRIPHSCGVLGYALGQAPPPPRRPQPALRMSLSWFDMAGCLQAG
eukprot:CAMPEP_0181174656 /NCGR_PEP_ID=MMETSP1096-20121128/3659_1 /TAXON_ID=156174 ORGANISM="Chrysochromulina ericina, Strain CCMP281" /NCGR_SAMPLE_ID=MMETSP1096 /ASSEMBLY_ACC=CAM_ASM_000453 /LENGTH=213 /DNA_ID=CAMNT_0023262585 /DNA_START=42 /DNA_END=684 /DNA_ORIENTATION=+